MYIYMHAMDGWAGTALLMMWSNETQCIYTYTMGRARELAYCTFCTEAQSLIADEFVGREAIVQLHHLNVVWADPSFLVG